MFRILRRAGASFKQFITRQKYFTTVYSNRPLFSNKFGRLISTTIFAGTLLAFTGGMMTKEQFKVNSLLNQ